MAAKAAAASSTAAASTSTSTTASASTASASASKAPKLSPEEIERRRTRQLELLESLSDELVSLTNDKCQVAAQKGHGYTKVAEYYLPGFDKVQQAQETVLVPRNPPELTHWAGRGVDPSKEGLPIVMLLQGVREQTGSGPRLRPDLLAGGKTALEIAQRKLEEADAGNHVRLDCSFNSKSKSLIVTAIWIEEDWQRFLSRRLQGGRRPPQAFQVPPTQGRFRTPRPVPKDM